MKLRNPFSSLTRFEWGLWLCSLATVAVSAFLSGDVDPLSLTASLLGVTALILVARGAWEGQLLCIVFATLYGIVSLRHRYYGEMITYLGMSLPMAVASLVEWLRNRGGEDGAVTVARLSRRRILFLAIADVTVTAVFYFLLRVLDTANLVTSTVSVATSFAAASLTLFRSPYYALAYGANDVVLIVLWVLAAIKDPSCLPMVACFLTFLANDLYGFSNWRRMQKRQTDNQGENAH